MELSISGVSIETDGMDEFRKLDENHETLVEEGIAPVVAAKLLKEFRSMEEIVRRDVDELAQADGISRQQAEEIHRNLHS